MTQQTAIEWMLEKISSGKTSIFDIIEIAKKIEKEQIAKAFDKGAYAYFYSEKIGQDFGNGEQYYNETYNK